MSEEYNSPSPLEQKTEIPPHVIEELDPITSVEDQMEYIEGLHRKYADAPFIRDLVLTSKIYLGFRELRRRRAEKSPPRKI